MPHTETDRSGRIKAKPDLTVPNYPTFFVAKGWPGAGGGEEQQAAPGRRTGSHSTEALTAFAKTVARSGTEGKTDVPGFHYFDKGDMAVIGRASAVANIFGFHVSGPARQLIWLFHSLDVHRRGFKIACSFFVQWGFEYLTFSRGARLITGTAESDVDKQTKTAERAHSQT